MNDTAQPSGFDWEAYQAQERESARLAAKAHPVNKAALFDALSAASVTTVIVQFDGYGDSGQIEGIEARSGDTALALPEGTIAFAEPRADNSGLEQSSLSISDAIEAMAYGFLEETHGGWENNEGAYGDFTFDVTNRTITLAYNERMMESDYSEHSF